MKAEKFTAWILATRPKTLTAAFIPILSATALTKACGFEIKWWIAGLCLLSALCIQIATNFINDAIDFDKGADTAERIGPQRATQRGWLKKRQILMAAGGFLFLALLAGVPLVLVGGWPIVAVGLISLLMAYSYTGGPFPLAYLGLGDLFVVIFFGLIAVGGVFYLQTGTYNNAALVLGLQIGFLSTLLIAINNMRDVHQDKKVNKRTLAVRFGVPFVRAEIVMLIFLTFLLQVYWLNWGVAVAAVPFIVSPLAVYIVVHVLRTEPSAQLNRFLGLSALLHSGFGLILSILLFVV